MRQFVRRPPGYAEAPRQPCNLCASALACHAGDLFCAVEVCGVRLSAWSAKRAYTNRKHPPRVQGDARLQRLWSCSLISVSRSTCQQGGTPW